MDFSLFMEKYGYKILTGIMFTISIFIVLVALLGAPLIEIIRGNTSEALQIFIFILIFVLGLGGVVYKTRPIVMGIFGRYWYKWKR